MIKELKKEIKNDIKSEIKKININIKKKTLEIKKVYNNEHKSYVNSLNGNIKTFKEDLKKTNNNTLKNEIKESLKDIKKTLTNYKISSKLNLQNKIKKSIINNDIININLNLKKEIKKFKFGIIKNVDLLNDKYDNLKTNLNKINQTQEKKQLRQDIINIIDKLNKGSYKNDKGLYVNDPIKLENNTSLTTRQYLRLLNKELPTNKKYVLTIDKTFYTLNKKTRARISDLIDYDIINNNNYSDAQIFDVLDKKPEIHISYYDEYLKGINFDILNKKKYNKRFGNFFNMTLKNNDLILDKYQIYNTLNIKEIKNINCFIKSLIESNILDENIILSISNCIGNRDITIITIKKISIKYKLNIIIKNNKTHKDMKFLFGEDITRDIINIGFINNHYFINDLTDYTLFYVKNYEKLKNVKNASICYKIINNNNKLYYLYDDKKRLYSYDLIKYLIDNKPLYLDDITYENTDIYETQYLNYIKNNEILNLNYDKSDVKISEIKKPDINDDKKDIYFFDFETRTNNNHIAYLLGTINDMTDEKKIYYGENCGLQFLETIKNDVLLIAHHATYDLNFIIKYMSKATNYIEKNGRMLNYTGFYKKYKITIKDSLSLINSKLSNFWQLFNLDQQKEIIPYKIYNNDILFNKRFLYLNEIIPYLKNDIDVILYINNCYKWGLLKLDIDINDEIKEYLNLTDLTIKIDNNNYRNKNIIKNDINIVINNDIINNNINNKYNKIKDTLLKIFNNLTIDIVEYSAKYCLIDCQILKTGYNKFKDWTMNGTTTKNNDIITGTGLNIDNILTLASLGYNYAKNKGVFNDTYLISGVVQKFIMSSIRGGRVMMNQNKKNKTNEILADFDAVSLYPSAMKRLNNEYGGFLKGMPKILTNLNYDNLSNYDGYFVTINITKVNKFLSFPLLAITNKKGVKEYTNEITNHNFIVDKFMLEDLIKYQKIEFNIINGYYFNEGRNNTIGGFIDELFNNRLTLKKDKNPAQLIQKELMNSIYGKTLLKPIEHDIIIISDKDIENYKTYNYNWIKSITQIHGSNNYKVELYKEIKSHFNQCHIGSEILSMSKRIMNEVITTAEDNEIFIYYQDTDSLHIKESDIDKLKMCYFNKYNKNLDGKEMGQFHSDFSLNNVNNLDERGLPVSCVDVKSSKSIFLGKKCYLDCLYGLDPVNGEIVKGYHIRLKGVGDNPVLLYGEKNNITPYDIYDKLFNNSSINFDLTADGLLCKFKQNKNFSIKTLDKFDRNIKF